MKETLAMVGIGALFAWTGLGIVAWSSAAQRVTVDFDDEEERAGERAELLEMGDALDALHGDVRALAAAMSENLQALGDGLLASQDEHAAAVEGRLAALRDEVGSRTSSSFPPNEPADLVRELVALRGPRCASDGTGAPARLVAAPVMLTGEEHAPTGPENVAAVDERPRAPSANEGRSALDDRQRASFLAFKLPSDDLRFDERRTWSILPSLSRIGFDAHTTLHDFTAKTSAIEGELEADLAHPDDAPRASLRLRSAALASGNAERDEAMHERLDAEHHPTLDFELTRFEPAEVDLAAKQASGRAFGRMTVRGVTQEDRKSTR